VFAPSTELFRQLAAQPGWMLASTRGSTVILQPETILNAHTGEVRSVLLHEMLHVLVEQEASADAPLWLREGLVEVLAGETHTDTGTRRNLAELRTAEIERSLRAPSSWSASKRAHQQAATEVQSLVDRYGMMSVRGWLSSSVPAGVESR